MKKNKPPTFDGDARANTGAHEQAISEGAKGMAAGVLDMAAVALNACIEKVGSEDPLAAERYIHLADTLSSIAERVYSIGERSRVLAKELYEEAKLR